MGSEERYVCTNCGDEVGMAQFELETEMCDICWKNTFSYHCADCGCEIESGEWCLSCSLEFSHTLDEIQDQREENLA